MAKIIALTNQKGGVGKTTTAVNLAAALKNYGKSVLLCDFDPQGNATSGFGIEPMELKESIYEVLVADTDIKKAIVSTEWVDVLGSNVNLAGAEIDLISLENREYRLKSVLDQVRDDYDYIIIDCPPSLGILTINCLCAADSFIVPLQCEYYALEGLSQLISTVKAIQKRFNPEIKLEGIVLTMFDGRTNLSLQVVEEVKTHFAKKVFSSVIPRNVRLSEAPSHGKPINEYDPFSKGAHAYQELAEEFLKRQV
ncbi:MAG: AAA family ATPase [Clostridia bacterium]